MQLKIYVLYKHMPIRLNLMYGKELENQRWTDLIIYLNYVQLHGTEK